jgi:magnesium chelatase family protein
VEDGFVSISRAAGTVVYPSQFLLIAAANPCPCGNYGSDLKKCLCMPGAVLRYRKRISGPLLDRIDLHMHVPPVQIEKFSESDRRESSETIRNRVQSARNIQNSRFSHTHIPANANMTAKMLKDFAVLSAKSGSFLRQAAARLSLSARSYYKMIKVARTIADLSGETEIQLHHVAEALQYRPTEDFG